MTKGSPGRFGAKVLHSMEETHLKPHPRSQSFEDGKKDVGLNRIVRDYIPDDRNINVCDYGCGRGVFLGALSNHPEKRIGKYLAVDLDPEAIKETKVRLKDNRQILTDSHVSSPENLDMKRYGGQFEVLLMHHVLHEVDPHKVLDEVFKLLKPDGKILIGDFVFFPWYEPDHVFWDCDSVKRLFDPEIFEVDSVTYTEKSPKREYECFFAEASLKRGASYPDIYDLLPRIKKIYQDMLGHCRNQIDAMGGPFPKDVPYEVRVYCDMEAHIKRRLEELENIPEMKTVVAVNFLIEKLKGKYYRWEDKYIEQEGKSADRSLLPPHEFLEITQLERLVEKRHLTKEAGKRKREEFGKEEDERAERQEFRKLDSSPLLEIIRKPMNRRLVLLGDPGMGKTTLLEFLCQYHAKNFKTLKTIPVYVALKYCTSKNNWLSSQIELFLNGLNIQEVTRAYHVLLLLDGYNEVGRGNLAFLDSEINDLLRTADLFSIIITSRKGTYPEFDGFNTCEIEPLDDTRIKRYFTDIFGHGRSDRVLRDLVENGLIGLARVPLFLGFICEFSERSGENIFPNTKGRLLERMIEIRYMRKPEEKLSKYKAPMDLMMGLLSEFCYNLVRENSGIGFEREELNGFIASRKEWIRKNFGMFNTYDIVNEIKEHGIVEDHFMMLSFWHQAIFEYFAARHLKRILERQAKDEKVLLNTFINHFRYKKWDEILSMVFDLLDKPLQQNLLKRFLVRHKRQGFDRISLLIDISKVVRISQPCVELLKHREPSVRSSAALALSEIKSSEVVNPLIDSLRDEDPSVRQNAAFALGEIKSPEAVKPLIQLLKDKVFSVRLRAARALGEIKSSEVVNPLIDSLKDEDPSVRQNAAFALGEIKSPEAVKPLIELLKDQNKFVRFFAISALGRIKSLEAVKPLIEFLKDQDNFIRERAALVLGEIKSPEAVKPLIELLKDENHHVRENACFALGKIKSPEAVRPLLELLKHEDRFFSLSAAHALGEIKSPEAVEPLIELLKHEDSLIRSSAALALVGIKSPEAVKPLIELLKDKDIHVSSSAARALGEIKSPEAVEPLIELLKHEDEFVRFDATRALEEIKSPKAVKPFIKLLKDHDPSTAARALGKIKSPEAVKPLIRLLKNERQYGRENVVFALCEIVSELGEKEMSNILLKLSRMIKGTDANIIYFYQHLKHIRYISKDLLRVQ